MLRASLAFTWILWRRHRWGLGMMGCFWFIAGATAAVLPAYCTTEVAQGVVGLHVVALEFAFSSVLWLFAYASDGQDILGRESCFPSSMFRLPVRTISLAAWPMACGAAMVALIWLVSARFLLLPWLAMIQVN